MSYTILKNNGPDGKINYVADSVIDLVELSKTNPLMGTSCLIIEDGSTYILNSEKEWVLLNNGGGSEDQANDSGVMVVNVIEQLNSSTFKVDKSFSDVAAYIAAPENTVVIYSTNMFGLCQLVMINGSREAPNQLLFSNEYKNGDSTTVNTLTWLPSNIDVVTLDTMSIDGGSGVFVAPFGPVTMEDGKIKPTSVLPHEMTRSQLINALNAGKMVVAKLSVQDGVMVQDYYLPLRSVWKVNNKTYTIDFNDSIWVSPSEGTIVEIGMPQEDQAVMSVYYYTTTQ